jgi:hypothetical protein
VYSTGGRRDLRAALLAPIAITASLLAGCSDGYIVTAGEADSAPIKTEHRMAVPAANAAIGERLASASARLDDDRLSEVRGGLDAGSGMLLSFSFQEATYVNHNLAQTIVVPTVTIAPGTSTMAAVSGLSNKATIPIAPITNSTVQTQVNSPAPGLPSLLNGGITQIASALGGGGLTNVISNSANNQLVQQVIAANIGITGLSQALQSQGVASNVMNRLTSATSQFR